MIRMISVLRTPWAALRAAAVPGAFRAVLACALVAPAALPLAAATRVASVAELVDALDRINKGTLTDLTVTIAPGTYDLSGVAMTNEAALLIAKSKVVLQGEDATSWRTRADSNTVAILDAKQERAVIAMDYNKVSGCTFRHLTIMNGYREGHGAGIFNGWYKYNVALTNCVLRNNRTGTSGSWQGGGGHSLTPTDCYFVDNYSKSDGGAMCASGPCIDCVFERNSSSVGQGGALRNGGTLTRCLFRENTAPNMVVFGGTYQATDCVFTNNTSGSRGCISPENKSGVVTYAAFRNCRFYDNRLTGSGASGCAIYMYIGDVSNCTFVGNASTNGYGGALYVANGATVRDCTFVNNSSARGGGAVHYVNTSSDYEGLVNCTFRGNTSARGGAILSQTASTAGLTLPITGCTFEDNVATGTGGAGAIQYANGSGTPGYTSEVGAGDVTNCTFAGNAAANGPGGAIGAPGGVTVADCRFAANASGAQGGAVYGLAAVTAQSCDFVSNGCESDGGAVYATTLTALDSLFTNNVAGLSVTASGRGGAVFASTDMAVTNCLFSGNAARTAGGAVYGTALSGISQCVFGGNGYPASMSHARYLYDGKTGLSFSGGALALGGEGTSVVADCLFTNNLVTSYSGFGTALSFGFSSGAIEWLNLSRCQFVGNRCAFDPDWTGVSPAMFSGSALSSLLSGSGKVGLLVDGCLFQDNVGGSGSGAITASGNNSSGAFRSGSSIRNSLFLRNTMQSSRAPGQGGAVSICLNVAVENCTFVDNVAGGVGGKSGAIFLGGAAGDGFGTVRNCLFVNNRNAAGEVDDIQTPSGYKSGSVSYCAALSALPSGTGNILLAEEPVFFNPAGGDYRLYVTNACTGAGVVADWMAGSTDYDGRTRLTDSKVDIGAYEGAAFQHGWHWINTANATANWATDAYWREGTYPNNYNDTSFLNDLFYFEGDLPFRQTVVGCTAEYQKPVYYGALIGSGSHLVALCATAWNHQFGVIRDASKFDGLIGSAYSGKAQGFGMWLLGGDSAHETVVNNASAAHGPSYDVYKGYDSAVIRRMWDTGRYFLFRDKESGVYGHFANADGHLTIEDNSGGITSLPETRGTASITYGGRTYDTPAIVGTPWVHLDASDAESLEIAAEGDRTHVTAWRDVRGTGFAAVADSDQPTPFLSTDPKTKRSVVDFGGFSASAKSVAHAGPSGTLVFNSGRRSDILEAFFVFRDAWAPLRWSENSCDTPNNPLQGHLCLPKGEKQYFRRHCLRRVGSCNSNSGLFQLTSVFWKDNKDTDDASWRDSVPMASADVRLDGANVHPQITGLYCDAFHVVSTGFRADLPVAGDRFACDPHGYIGGLALAEVLLYTNSLTSAERRRVNAYLRAKWQGAYDAADWDCMMFKATYAAKIGVKDGETFTAGEFWARDLSVAKTGGGTLEIARLRPADDNGQLHGESPILNVQGGRVDFVETHEDSLAEAPDAPPVDPDVWLDADRGVTTFTTNVFGKKMTYVSTWADRRGTNRWGEVVIARKGNVKGVAACYPRLKTQVLNGHNLIDCGTNSINWTDFAWTGAEDPAGMIVTRDTTGCDWSSVADYFAVIVPFGSSLAWMTVSSFFPATGYLTSDQQFSYGFPANGDWSVNGYRVNPCAYAYTKGDPIVVHFRMRTADEGQTGGPSLSFMESGHGSGLLGGIRMGEMLYYHGHLLPEEVRATEAYLMRKWLAQDHPDMVNAKKTRALTSVVYDEGVKAAMNVEGRAVEVKNHIRLDGGFAKGGSGALSSRTISASVSGFDVEGGSLTTTASGVGDLLASAAFHVDASRFDTFTWSDKENRRIDRWYDASGNGRYAKTPLNPLGTNPAGLTNAVYAVSDGSLDLPAEKPYVDMLAYANGATEATVNTASGFLWYNGDGSNYRPTDVREWHIVFKMTMPGGTGNVAPIGGESYPVSYSLVPSGTSPGGFWSSCTYAKNGWKKTDDCSWFTRNSWLSNGTDATTKFYVMTIQTTGNVSPWSFGIDRGDCGRGGLKLCEAIVYAGATNTTADAEAIHRYLLKKWKDVGDGDTTQVTLDTLKVATGASLELGTENGREVLVSEISGGGTVTIPSGTVFREKGVFDVAMTAPHTVGTLDFKGLFTCPDEATVNFTVADGLTSRDVSGTYLILTADEFENLPAAQYWKLVAPTYAGGRLKMRLEVREKGLYLSCRTGGFAIMFRKHREE